MKAILLKLFIIALAFTCNAEVVYCQTRKAKTAKTVRKANDKSARNAKSSVKPLAEFDFDKAMKSVIVLSANAGLGYIVFWNSSAEKINVLDNNYHIGVTFNEYQNLANVGMMQLACKKRENINVINNRKYHNIVYKISYGTKSISSITSSNEDDLTYFGKKQDKHALYFQSSLKVKKSGYSDNNNRLAKIAGRNKLFGFASFAYFCGEQNYNRFIQLMNDMGFIESKENSESKYNLIYKKKIADYPERYETTLGIVDCNIKIKLKRRSGVKQVRLDNTENLTCYEVFICVEGD